MPHHVAAGILLASDRVLLCHRAADRRWYADCWDFRGGHIEHGETAQTALIRELEEELGVQVGQLSEEPAFEIRERAEETDGLVLTAWFVEAWVGEPTNVSPDEHDDMRWFEASQLPTLSLAHTAYREALTKIFTEKSCGMPDLIAPTNGLHAAWLEAHKEWGPGLHEDGFGLQQSDEVESTLGFTTWVERLSADEHCTYRWITQGDQVLGGIALRHDSNSRVQRAGHLGYGICPSARRRGLAVWALGRMVEEARTLSMKRVSIVCEVGNVASAKTIESQGGVLDDLDETESSTTLRYWIQT